jgi:hypothetical protein
MTCLLYHWNRDVIVMIVESYQGARMRRDSVLALHSPVPRWTSEFSTFLLYEHSGGSCTPKMPILFHSPSQSPSTPSNHTEVTLSAITAMTGHLGRTTCPSMAEFPRPSELNRGYGVDDAFLPHGCTTVQVCEGRYGGYDQAAVLDQGRRHAISS